MMIRPGGYCHREAVVKTGSSPRDRYAVAHLKARARHTAYPTFTLEKLPSVRWNVWRYESVMGSSGYASSRASDARAYNVSAALGSSSR